MSPGLTRRLLAEFLGSAFLAALVIASGIAAQQLSPDDTGLLIPMWPSSASRLASSFGVWRAECGAFFVPAPKSPTSHRFHEWS